MKSLRALFLAALLVPAAGLGYWIQHSNVTGVFNPADNPEQYRPAADGSRPGPGKPPAAVTIEILPLPAGWNPEVAKAVARGIESWNYIPGSAMKVIAEGPRPGRLNDGGWASRFDADDGRNTIEFVQSGWSSIYPSSVIAVTHPHLDPDGRMVEADIFCNAQDYDWRVFLKEGHFPELTAGNMVDVEAIVAHEMGHMLGLGHSQETWSAMWTYPGLADTRARRLTRDDHMGILALYPKTAADLPPPSIWKAARDNFGDGKCGMTVISFFFHGDYGRQITFSGSMPANVDYCLFGSGFVSGWFGGTDLYAGGMEIYAVDGDTYVGPNFVRGTVKNGVDGFPALDLGAYDIGASHLNGATAWLQAGLVLNSSTNNAPLAAVQPSADTARQGDWIGLDGSGSTDADGDTLSYQWSLVEVPPGAAATLDSTTSEKSGFHVPAAGMYVVRLVVNDGLVDSIADQAVIRGLPPDFESGSSSYSPFGCAAAGTGGKGRWQLLPLLFVPAAIILISRLRRAAG